ncbi:MAG: type II toxin-antitoxin system Phd/YefM family antitoxin [Lentimonas sp.]
MDIVALYDAKNRLSEICNQVSETGQPCVISRRGQPLVKLVAIEPDDSKESVWDTLDESRALHGRLNEDFDLLERSSKRPRTVEDLESLVEPEIPEVSEPSGEPTDDPTWLL